MVLDDTAEGSGAPREAAAPGLAAPLEVGTAADRLLVVGDQRFRVRLRPRRDGSYEYDYTWLTGPNASYGFGLSGPFALDEDAHRENIREFLAEIDPATGYLSES